MTSSLIGLLPYLYYFTAIILAFVLKLATPLTLKKSSVKRTKHAIGIAAGPKGWQSNELKELYTSAVEYFGKAHVYKLYVDRSKPHAPQLDSFIRQYQITHFIFDPRAWRQESDQNYFNALSDSLAILRVLIIHGVVPLGYLTDISFRIWRSQAAVVTSLNGIVVTFAHPKPFQHIFPHSRILGPSIMPFSIKTLNKIKSRKNELIRLRKISNVVRFVGSLYEPRISFLNQFKTIMGTRADIQGRSFGSERQPEYQYWDSIASAAIVITTAEQVIRPGFDLSSVNQLVYRYLEVMAADSLLLAPWVMGMERYFVPGVDFVVFSDLNDACKKAHYYLDRPDEARKISKSGHAKASALINCHAFWLQADAALSIKGFFS